MKSPPAITRLLIEWSNGDRSALDELTPLVYRELHALARTYLGRPTRNHTLQPTALINEVYVRLIDQSQPILWECRSHFFGIAARLMRLVLVDHARARRAEKRGGKAAFITLEETLMVVSPERPPDILQVDEAVTRLAKIDEREARVIELRYFAGMTYDEVACATGLSVATVKREARLAEAWLRRELLGLTG